MGSGSRGGLLTGVELASSTLLQGEEKENDGVSLGTAALASAALTGALRDIEMAEKEEVNVPMDVLDGRKLCELKNGEVLAEVVPLRVAPGAEVNG